MVPVAVENSTTTVPSVQQNGVNWASVLAPYILQAVAIICMTIIVAVHDGISTDSVVNTLAFIAGGNVLLGGTTAVVHTITNASVQRMAIKSGGTPNANV